MDPFLVETLWWGAVKSDVGLITGDDICQSFGALRLIHGVYFSGIGDSLGFLLRGH